MLAGAENSGMLLIGCVVLLMGLSAFFSGTETALMAVNRYRLRHLVKRGNRGARKASKMLDRPDRLLGVILVGNNLVNFSAATLATVIGIHYFGDLGLLMAPWVMTLLFLIFSEVAPKTFAAENSELWSLKAVFVLDPLSKVLRPVVIMINWFSNTLVKPFMNKDSEEDHDQLSKEELITVVTEGGEVIGERQSMMTRLLDLESVTVNDILIPRNEVICIDIENPIEQIIQELSSSPHTLLPIYKDSFANVLGVLHLRQLAKLLDNKQLSKSDILRLAKEAYYVPEGTPLNKQLLNFQKERERFALVVDEYGDVEGIVTLEDILEEIVGEFTSDSPTTYSEIVNEGNDSFRIDGTSLLRDINRALGWDLPISGPKTLNGLVLEYLETLPDQNIGLQIDSYQIETIAIKDNMIKTLRVKRSKEQSLEEVIPD